MSSPSHQIETLKALSAKLKANLHVDEPVEPVTLEEKRRMAALAKEDEPVVESEEQRLKDTMAQQRVSVQTLVTKRFVPSFPKHQDCLANISYL